MFKYFFLCILKVVLELRFYILKYFRRKSKNKEIKKILEVFLYCVEVFCFLEVIFFLIDLDCNVGVYVCC